jgi:hypothetical protein
MHENLGRILLLEYIKAAIMPKSYSLSTLWDRAKRSGIVNENRDEDQTRRRTSDPERIFNFRTDIASGKQGLGRSLGKLPSGVGFPEEYRCSLNVFGHARGLLGGGSSNVAGLLIY